ncbi:MAG: homocysteine S-methyltransferase family protein [Pelagibacteraceae bacterium]|nr:homocysteine S-methyltransferase family protein [Pelagibacteraceae bacterium]
MDNKYFSKTRILDGGMGQELLKRGLKPRGTLWSASALIDEKYHQLVIDTHLDFINAGADVIVTTTFTARRSRLIQNKCEKYFEYINTKAVELALKARDFSKKNILIAGGLPNQYQTYSANLGDDLNLIEKNFYDQAKLLKKNIDFFYLDVMGSGKECEIALKTIKSFNLPVLVGVHIRKNGKLPSGENVSDIVKKYKDDNWLGIITACVAPEYYEIIIKELKNLNIPYGFKLNAFKNIPDNYGVSSSSTWGENGNPNIILGSRKDINPDKFYDFAKKFKDNGATILGGCCEIGPSHINKIAKLK